MPSSKFDYSAYSKINSGEVTLKLSLKKGKIESNRQKIKKTKLGEKILRLENQERSEIVSAIATFENKSSREVHIDDRFWYFKLKVYLNEKQMNYLGPLVSLAPPNKEDFLSIGPGLTGQTDPVDLTENFGVPADFNGSLKVVYKHIEYIPESEATLFSSK